MESCPGGFRARLKKGDRTFNGPVRETEAAAQEDQKQYKTAVAEALDKLQEVHQTFAWARLWSCYVSVRDRTETSATGRNL